MKTYRIRYSVSQSEFLEAHEEHWKLIGHSTYSVVLTGSICMAVGVIIAFLYGWTGYLLATVGLIMTILPAWRRNLHARAFGEIKKYKDQLEVEFGEEQIAVRTSEGDSRLNWSTYDKVIDTPKYVLLYLSPNSFSIIPKRAFDEKTEDFLKFAKERIANQSLHLNPASPGR